LPDVPTRRWLHAPQFLPAVGTAGSFHLIKDVLIGSGVVPTAGIFSLFTINHLI
jgi:hypothetical protein